MNYQSPELRRMLAAEYALGTLQGRARSRFERLLEDDADLRSELTFWETRLARLGLDLAPVTPDPRVWAAIEQRIGRKAARAPAAAPAREPWWRQLNLWRGGFALSAAVSVVLAIMLWVAPAPVPPPTDRPSMQYVSVITNNQNEPAWLFAADPHRNAMSVKAMPGHPKVPEGKDLELWMLPGGGQPPVSMALIPRSGRITGRMPPEMMTALKEAEGLAVSLEPKGGSPTGKPTGPVLYTAQIMSTM